MATSRSDLDGISDILNNVKNPQSMQHYMLPEFEVTGKSGIGKIESRPAQLIKSDTGDKRIQNVVNTQLANDFTGTKNRKRQQKKLEKAANKGELQIKPGESLALEGGSDYYTQGSNVLSDVDLEDGNVIGVNTPKSGFLQRIKKNK